MVRYTLALSGPAKDNAPALEVEEKVVDIFNQKQLLEDFLKLNPYGQVNRPNYLLDLEIVAYG
jgi:glutathione S-transferase